METTLSSPLDTQLTDIIGLHHSGIFPKDKEPSIRTACVRPTRLRLYQVAQTSDQFVSYG